MRPWSAAIPSSCPAGHRHASRLEARVCARLALEARADRLTLFQQLRVPLLTLAPGPDGRPLYATVDFALVRGGQIVRLVDAKGRRSREWLRGAAAVHAATGIPVQEIYR